MSQAETLSLSEEVATRLEEEILHGRRKPGDRLDERQLAEQYGVSRTPVREALQRLAASGLVVSRGKQGLQVAKLAVADLLDAFSVVAELEALAAGQAARRITPAQKEEMIKAHAACEEAVLRGDADAFFSANIAFHQVIAAASHNRVLQDQLRRLTVKTSPYRRIITFQADRMSKSIPEHNEVMDAIFRGDSLGASQALRGHVTLLGEGLSDLIHFLSMDVDLIQT
ncbi:GntR family transcriptional regulator [Pseudochelatococcus sp. G4_1912]|uniref:GntR family transcriptional regulator n=1 Tax=Pseudochelatococcus sp. G4_1912 TaxID=3114288 RepID=UPI0039C75FB6